MAKAITFDPTDFHGMCGLMDSLGNSTTMYPGMNENGENTNLSVYTDRIVCSTLQKNGWVRINTYWRDGTQEETFDGRWK